MKEERTCTSPRSRRLLFIPGRRRSAPRRLRRDRRRDGELEVGHPPAEGRADRAERAQRPGVHAVDVHAPSSSCRRSTTSSSPSRRTSSSSPTRPTSCGSTRPQGYNLIIAHGSQYGGHDPAARAEVPEGLVRVGHGEPRRSACRTSTRTRPPRTRAATSRATWRELISKSKVIGVIGPIAVGDAKLYVDGFKAGALAANPEATVHVSYTGSFSDPSLMSKQATEYLAAEGGRPDRQLAVRRRRDHRREARTTSRGSGRSGRRRRSRPSRSCPPRSTTGRACSRRSSPASRPASSADRSYTINLNNGGEKIQYNPGYDLSAAVKAKVQKVIAGIEKGSIKAPK